MLFRGLLLLTVCIGNSQTRKIPQNIANKNEVLFENEHERTSKYEKLFEKWDESENIIRHTLDDVKHHSPHVR